jgi:hypothetical protein
MQKRRPGSKKARVFWLETLEGRIVQSGTATAVALPHGSVEVAAKSTHKVATQTTLSVNAGTVGSPIVFNVTVKAPAGASAPTGTVNIIQHGQVIQSLNLTPMFPPASSTAHPSAVSQATSTLTQQPGGSDLFFGKYPITAQFVPTGSFLKSSVNTTFAVRQPTYTTLTGGVQVATVIPGSGPTIQTGQTANVFYTGYLASTGQIFDSSVKDGGPAFNFTLGSGQVIPGFDLGTTGMQVGETRIVKIPAAEGYGATSNGTIPPNSTLIFVLTLASIT